MEFDKNKYKSLENILNTAIKNYVSLPEVEKKRNNIILDQILKPLVEKLKARSVLFKSLFERMFYGGSYYDNLKVGKPEEYDLDWVFKLPLIVEPELIESDRPGYVHVKMTQYKKLLLRPEAPSFEKLDTLFDDNLCLSTTKVLPWLEGLISKITEDMPKNEEKKPIQEIDLGAEGTVTVVLDIIKQFPAFTLKVRGGSRESPIKLDVDLVPCFQFTGDKWPKVDYRQNPSPSKNKFLIVPKKVYDLSDSSTYWRLSFQEQERELMTSSDYRSMKSAIRLLKKLRDTQNHIKIASYYIKTLFLWELQSQNKEFWGLPLSCIFMTMLKKYADAVRKQEIFYYWNAKNNLIGHLNASTCETIGNTIHRIIKDVDTNIDEDPFVIVKYLLPTEYYEKIKSDEFIIGKKHLKNIQSSKKLINKPPPREEQLINVEPTSTSLIDTPVVLQDSNNDEIHSKLDRILNIVSNLQNDNKTLKKMCLELSEKVQILEGKIDEIQKGDKKSSNTSVDDLLSFDNLKLTAQHVNNLL